MKVWIVSVAYDGDIGGVFTSEEDAERCVESYGDWPASASEHEVTFGNGPAYDLVTDKAYYGEREARRALEAKRSRH
jgi:hypothetical protein